MEYAIINPAGSIVQTRSDAVPVAEHKGWRILPVVRDVPAEGERLTPPVEPVPEDAVEVRWTAVPKPAEEFVAERRARRKPALDRALARLDRHRNQKDFGLPCTLTDAQAQAWANHAQALRDYPETGEWPTEPEGVV